MNKALKEFLEIIKANLIENGAERISVFGSYARGEEDSNSDLDILVKFSKQKSLLDLVRIERNLSEKLGIKVDLITENALNPHISKTIEKEKLVICG